MKNVIDVIPCNWLVVTDSTNLNHNYMYIRSNIISTVVQVNRNCEVFISMKFRMSNRADVFYIPNLNIHELFYPDEITVYSWMLQLQLTGNTMSLLAKAT